MEIGWEEVKRRNAPLWLRVSCEMWPINVENFKPHLGAFYEKMAAPRIVVPGRKNGKLLLCETHLRAD